MILFKHKVKMKVRFLNKNIKCKIIEFLINNLVILLILVLKMEKIMN